MKLNRNYVTPFISLIFLVVGISGLLMFFHLFDGYTEVVHEYLGVTFVACAIFHIILNWRGLKSHFGKKVFIPALLGVLTTSAILIVLEKMNPPVDMIIINKIIKAPIADVFKVLEIDYSEASKRLETKNIVIGNSKTLEDIWINNESDPEVVIDLLME